MSTQNWHADRLTYLDPSGIRKVFDLAKDLKNPINLSIGQPDFQVPEAIRQKAVESIQNHFNGYTVTQGIDSARNALKVREGIQNTPERELILTSGTSGGLVLALLATVNPGDEVIILDPWFALYPNMIRLAGGTPVPVCTYPDFDLPVNRIREKITTKTKAILLNSPGNPSGRVYPIDQIKALCELAKEKGILVISDEIYSAFTYEKEFVSPFRFNSDTLVVSGLGKSYGFTGWRVGFAHGPKDLIQQMIKLQQFIYVCTPTPAQHAIPTALDCDITPLIETYKAKRDYISDRLQVAFPHQKPEGAFYLFLPVPIGWTGTSFVAEAIRRELLIIPGNVFGEKDTHFRVSYAASQETLEKGSRILLEIAKLPPPV
jgi:aspartate aminotransferase/aminotransferase